jgi:hypothetical protein
VTEHLNLILLVFQFHPTRGRESFGMIFNAPNKAVNTLSGAKRAIFEVFLHNEPLVKVKRLKGKYSIN